MPEPLVVNLLGPPRFSQAKAPVTCASRKALGLFAYLALSPRAHARRELAALFWGRGDEESARASLRVALHRLPAAMAQCLRVDRDSIAVSAPPLIDVATFESLARADDLDSLERAAALYQGELLQDFEADATPEFDDWLHAQRTRLAQLAQHAFEGAIARRSERARRDTAHAATERESALATGQRWAALMPGAEAAHRWLVQLYVEMGRRDAAIAQYDVCQRFLAVTYGRAPSAQMRELYEAALGHEATPEARGDAREPVARSLVPATSFVGRIEELAELDRLLSDPNCRLLTLHGLGGAGKTRLAHALASQMAAQFAQGVAWVALEAATGDALPVAIATALGRELPPRGDRADAIAAMLAGQERLLVLDNLEALLAHDDVAEDAQPATVIARIVARAPKVRVLATSREVLGLQEEWVYDVHGLAHEPQASLAGAAPAVELFAQRARQAYLGFSLPAEMPHVLRICALVEGLPLGIELAAAWVRTIPCGEIAAAIERTGASLESRHRNRAERHRSLDAVVAYSWDLLTTGQRSTLAALSAFAGGFTREAAEQVADATLRTLSVLVDKALVRRRPEGRYDLHEIVRQFALARLASKPARHAAVMRRHAEVFAEAMLRILADARSPAEASADAAFVIEMPNLLAAHDRAVAAAWRDLVARTAAHLTAMLATRGYIRVALAVAERATALLAGHGHDDALAAVRCQYGRSSVLAGHMDAALRELEGSLELARRAGTAATLARCLYFLGTHAALRGDLDEVERLASEQLRVATAAGDLEYVALGHRAAGYAASLRAQSATAEEHSRQALAAARENGRPSLVAAMLINLTDPLYAHGRLDEALAAAEEGAAILASLGRHAILPMVRGTIASILLAKGDVAGALPHARAAVDLARETADQGALGATLVTLADIELRKDARDDARAAAREALQVAQSAADVLTVCDALFLLASAETGGGRREEAHAHLLALRDALARRRIEARIPLLAMGTAQWVVAFDPARVPRARAWLAGLVHLPGIDAPLRERARALLAREGGEPAAPATLAEVEADVLAFLQARSS